MPAPTGRTGRSDLPRNVGAREPSAMSIAIGIPLGVAMGAMYDNISLGKLEGR